MHAIIANKVNTKLYMSQPGSSISYSLSIYMHHYVRQNDLYCTGIHNLTINLWISYSRNSKRYTQELVTIYLLHGIQCCWYNHDGQRCEVNVVPWVYQWVDDYSFPCLHSGLNGVATNITLHGILIYYHDTKFTKVYYTGPERNHDFRFLLVGTNM